MITPNDHDRPQVGLGVIRTRTGLYVEPLDLQPHEVRLTDIATALSHICRYGGHVAEPYSVAEHSLYVANQVRRSTNDLGLTLAALLHDAAEAYLGDIPSPLKKTSQFDAYVSAELQAEEAIERAFDLEHSVNHDLIREADQGILAWEMAMFRDAPLRTSPDPVHLQVAFTNRVKALLQQTARSPMLGAIQ